MLGPARSSRCATSRIPSLLEVSTIEKDSVVPLTRRTHAYLGDRLISNPPSNGWAEAFKDDYSNKNLTHSRCIPYPPSALFSSSIPRANLLCPQTY